MGLKRRPVPRPVGFPRGLKSDQNGIETRTRPLRLPPFFRLKSDQNGIETMISVMMMSSSARLKSDQNGIETEIVHRQFGCNGVQNQTKMGLKQEMCGIFGFA